ncbi:hypothetical protein DFJ73DRAFT_815247 [Zopfochytrium polystomum]|nr:hypothetical protein DFJ73DRAFT_815247 [Zopfochytrium polystomum]
MAHNASPSSRVAAASAAPSAFNTTAASSTYLPPRLPFPVAIAICCYLSSPHDAFTVATLLRLPRQQAATLFQIHRQSVDRIDSTTALDFLLRHLPLDNLRLAYSKKAMDRAKSTEILQWWRNCGMTLWYSKVAIKRASSSGRIDLLQWWKESGLPLQYSARAVRLASAAGQVHVLQWWLDSGLEFKYNPQAVHEASANGHVKVLQWWRDSGLPLKCTEKAVQLASRYGHTSVLQWWKESGLPFLYDHSAIDTAVSNGRAAVLQWWKESGFRLRYSRYRSVKAAVRRGRVECLQWWWENGMETDWYRVPFYSTDWRKVLEWWEASGLFHQWLERQPEAQRAIDGIIDRTEFTRIHPAACNWWHEKSDEVAHLAPHQSAKTLFVWRLPQHCRYYLCSDEIAAR